MMTYLRGIITPIVTPLRADYSLDIESYQRIINHVIEGGVMAVFALGTTGEFSSLSFSMKKEVILKTCAFVNKRIQTLIGISSCDLQESLALAAFAFENNADALVACPPFYFNMNQEEVIVYYEELADKVKLPLYLYNMPGLTKNRIEPETAQILSEHPNIIGLKDSSGDLDYFAELCQFFSGNDFDLFVGPEELLADSLKFGAHGGVNGGSNLYPRWYVELFDAFNESDLEKVKLLQAKIRKLSTNVYQVSKSPNSYLQGLKTAMSAHGLCSSLLASPLAGLNEIDRNKIIENLNEFH